MKLKEMTEKQLSKLKEEIDVELKNRSQEKLVKARQAIEDTARKHGFTLNDILGGKGKKSKVAAKYRNLSDTSQVWSGRGRQPAWFREALATGISPDDMLI